MVARECKTEGYQEFSFYKQSFRKLENNPTDILNYDFRVPRVKISQNKGNVIDSVLFQIIRDVCIIFV